MSRPKIGPLAQAPSPFRWHGRGVEQAHPPIKEKTMMGQLQQTVTAAGGVLRRRILLLAVAAVMAAMVALTAAPAFASYQGPVYRCVIEQNGGTTTTFVKKAHVKKM